MRIVDVLVAASPDDCWSAFTSPAFWIAWVPGLRCARVLARTPDALPREVSFEYAGGASYTLAYTYDVAARLVRWQTRDGDRGGVRGFARFSPGPDGQTLFVYALEHDGTRTAIEAELDDARLLADSFARYLVTRDGSA